MDEDCEELMCDNSACEIWSDGKHTWCECYDDWNAHRCPICEN